LITEETEYWIKLFKHYENGILAVAGGVLDQPSIYLEAMEIIQQRTNFIRAEKMQHGNGR